MKNKMIQIKIINWNSIDIIKKLININVFYRKMIFIDKSTHLIICNKDYKKIVKLFNKKNVFIIKRFGLEALKSFFLKHYMLICAFVFSYIVLIVLSNLIFEIKIITNNNFLKEKLMIELAEYGIDKYKFKKNYKELSKIKESILYNNKEFLEWMEIKDDGTKLIIELTERIKTTDNNTSEVINDIIASKDSLVMYIVTKKGTKLISVGDYVKKGDVLISADIIKNEEVVGIKSASGKVFGEVWYTVKTLVPFNYVEYVSTGKIINHYYLNIFGNKMTLLGKYNSKYFNSETELIVSRPYLFFKLYKEKKEEFEYKKFSINQDTAYQEALNRSDKSLNLKLSKEEYIIDKKVLKKTVYSSKIEIEVFYKVYENIGIEIERKELSEENNG